MFLHLLLLLGHIYDTFDLSVIFEMIIGYIRLGGDFQYMVRKYYYDKSSRGEIPEIFKTIDLDTLLCSSWLQILSFECREIRKRKNHEHMSCPFYVCLSFDRKIGRNIIKKCVLAHEGHVGLEASIYGHARFESDLSVDEKNELVKCGRMGSTAENAKMD